MISYRNFITAITISVTGLATAGTLPASAQEGTMQKVKASMPNNTVQKNTSMPFSFSNKRVLIIGGSSGIGEAAAKAFAEAGAQVLIASRTQSRLEAAAARIGHGVQTAVLDITDNSGIEAFFAKAGNFDHIVVSASQTRTGSVRELPLADAYAGFDSKFWGAYRVARAARINEHGSLTLISGYFSVRPSTAVLQGAINSALESLGRGLALELAPQRVRVNTVSPGLIASPLWDRLSDDSRQALYDNAASMLPARTIGRPEDIANAIIFLAATPYATGSTVLVDGGGAIEQQQSLNSTARGRKD